MPSSASDPLAPFADFDCDPSIVSEPELRRWLRHASVVLATAEPPQVHRYQLLRRARHWARAALRGIDQLVREEERLLGIPETLDDPLTDATRPITIEPTP